MKLLAVMKDWFSLRFQFKFFLMISPACLLLYSEPAILGIAIMAAEFLGVILAWVSLKSRITFSMGTPHSIAGLPLVYGDKDVLGNGFYTID